VALLAVVALLLFGAAAAGAEELRPEQRYAGGTRVESSSAGVSFVTPTGWAGKFGQNAKHQVLVMGSTTIEGVGLAIIQTGPTAAQVIASLSEPQDLGAGVILKPTAAPIAEGSLIVARYQNDVYVGRALAMLGPDQHTVVFFFAGPQKNEGIYTQLIAGLGKSASFTAPSVAAGPAPAAATGAWSQLLSGQMLHYFSSYNSGGSSGGMAAHRVLHLCADGRFAYVGDSSITMNVPGASASSGGRSGFRGRWTIESPTDANAVLVLVGDDGRQLRWPVRYDGQKTFVNGQRWLRAASDACR
jgi:hypothetical protein